MCKFNLFIIFMMLCITGGALAQQDAPVENKARLAQVFFVPKNLEDWSVQATRLEIPSPGLKAFWFIQSPADQQKRAFAKSEDAGHVVVENNNAHLTSFVDQNYVFLTIQQPVVITRKTSTVWPSFFKNQDSTSLSQEKNPILTLDSLDGLFCQRNQITNEDLELFKKNRPRKIPIYIPQKHLAKYVASGIAFQVGSTTDNMPIYLVGKPRKQNASALSPQMEEFFLNTTRQQFSKEQHKMEAALEKADEATKKVKTKTVFFQLRAMRIHIENQKRIIANTKTMLVVQPQPAWLKAQQEIAAANIEGFNEKLSSLPPEVEEKMKKYSALYKELEPIAPLDTEMLHISPYLEISSPPNDELEDETDNEMDKNHEDNKDTNNRIY